MKNKSVIRKRISLDKKLAKLYDERKKLQEECGHPNVEKRNWSDTGNYDRSMDCYGTDYTCPDCGKRWSESHKAKIYYHNLMG